MARVYFDYKGKISISDSAVQYAKREIMRKKGFKTIEFDELEYFDMFCSTGRSG